MFCHFFSRFFVIAVFVAFGGSFAQAVEDYTITSVVVEAAGKNSKIARDQAIRKGQKESFLTMLERVSPKLTLDTSSLESLNIASMVSSMDIRDEHISPQHYKAAIDISFNPMLVNEWLQSFGVVVVEKKQPRFLVIPMIFSQGQWGLSDSNGWYSIWVERNRSASFYAPKRINNIQNIVDVNTLVSFLKGDIYSYDFSVLQQQYNVDGVLVTGLLVSKENNATVLARRSYGSDISSFSKSFDYDQGEGEAASLVAVADELMTYFISVGVKQVVVADNTIKAEVSFSSLAEWNAIKREVEHIHAVEKVNVQQLMMDKAVVDIFYSGDVSLLEAQLREKGFSLVLHGDRYVLSRQVQPPEQNRGWFGGRLFSNP